MKRIHCEQCAFWSDRVAKHEHGTMYAVCLNVGCEHYGKFTAEDDGCAKGMQGEPIDSQRAKVGA